MAKLTIVARLLQHRRHDETRGAGGYIGGVSDFHCEEKHDTRRSVTMMPLGLLLRGRSRRFDTATLSVFDSLHPGP